MYMVEKSTSSQRIFFYLPGSSMCDDTGKKKKKQKKKKKKKKQSYNNCVLNRLTSFLFSFQSRNFIYLKKQTLKNHIVVLF